MNTKCFLLSSLTLLTLAAPADAANRYAGPFGYPTIQAAVDAAAPGDVVQIYPQTWRESVRITKPLTLEKLPGMSGTATIIGTASGAVNLDVHDGQSVTLRNVTLQGNGGPVVKGPTWVSASRSPYVTIDMVNLWSGTAGVTGFMNLTMKASNVLYPSGAGISITGGGFIDNVMVLGSGGNGIAINTFNGGSTWNVIRKTRVLSPEGMGIRIDYARDGAYWLDEVEVDDARSAGIFLSRADGANLNDVTVTDTRKNADGSWGDGIVLWESEGVNLSTSVVSGTDRAAISAFGCAAPGKPASISLLDVDILRNPLDLNAERSVSGCTKDATMEDLGDNRCVDPNGHERPCQLLSSELEPPKFVAP